MLFSVGNFLSTSSPVDLYYWPILLSYSSLFHFSLFQYPPIAKEIPVYSSRPSWHSQVSHAKNWSIWKETIWKLPNLSNKEITRVLECKCQRLTVWSLTRNQSDQEFLRCLFTPCHWNWSSIADKSAEIWGRRCGILLSSHLKLLLYLQKRWVCIPSPSAAGYMWNDTAKCFSKFTYSVFCVKISFSYLGSSKR